MSYVKPDMVILLLLLFFFGRAMFERGSSERLYYMLGDASADLCYQDCRWAQALVFVFIVRNISNIYYEREELMSETI